MFFVDILDAKMSICTALSGQNILKIGVRGMKEPF